MLSVGPAVEVSIYVGDGAHDHHHAVAQSILEFLFRQRVAGATVFRGIAGFGAGHHLHGAGIEVFAGNLPVKIEFIETAARVEELVPKLRELVGEGMIARRDIEIVKPATTHSKEPAR